MKEVLNENDHRMFAVKIRKIADISNTAKKVLKVASRQTFSSSRLSFYIIYNKLLIFDYIFIFFKFDINLKKAQN